MIKNVYSRRRRYIRTKGELEKCTGVNRKI